MWTGEWDSVALFCFLPTRLLGLYTRESTSLAFTRLTSLSFARPTSLAFARSTFLVFARSIFLAFAWSISLFNFEWSASVFHSDYSCWLINFDARKCEDRFLVEIFSLVGLSLDPDEVWINSCCCVEYFGFYMLLDWGEILSCPLIGMDILDFARFISGCIAYNLFSSSMDFLDFACFISGCIEDFLWICSICLHHRIDCIEGESSIHCK